MFESGNASKKSYEDVAIHKLQYLENEMLDTFCKKNLKAEETFFFALQTKQALAIYLQIWPYFNL